MGLEEKDYYGILGVRETATNQEILSAFHNLAKKYHPDLHPEWEKAEMSRKFEEINEAHEVLLDPAQRARYDNLRGTSRPSQAAGPGWGKPESSSWEEYRPSHVCRPQTQAEKPSAATAEPFSYWAYPPPETGKTGGQGADGLKQTRMYFAWLLFVSAALLFVLSSFADMPGEAVLKIAVFMLSVCMGLGVLVVLKIKKIL